MFFGTSRLRIWRPRGRKPTPRPVGRRLTRIRAGYLGQISGNGDRETIAKQLPATIFLLSVCLYFAGWMYAFYLYRHFGISLRVVDPPVYYIFVYAYSVLSFNVPAFILSALFVTVVMGLQLRPATPLLQLILGLLVVGSFPLAQFMSYRAAENTALGMRQGYGVRSVTVTFMSDSTKSRLHPAFVSANDSEELRLFAQTADAYLFLVQPEAPTGDLPIGQLVLVPKTAIASVALNVN